MVTLFSTLILVSQNLYSKEIFKHQKVHEIVLVMNVAGLAFFANLPLYVYFDLLSITTPGAIFDVRGKGFCFFCALSEDI